LVFQTYNFTVNGAEHQGLNSGVYGPWVTSFKCSNTNSRAWKDASSSFPSTETALFSFCATVLVAYIKAIIAPIYTAKPSASSTLIRFLCIWISSWICFGAALLSISGYADNQYHIPDIIAGIFLGIAAGLIPYFNDITCSI
jgi:hypothetical protein